MLKVVIYDRSWTGCYRHRRHAGSGGSLALYILFSHQLCREDRVRSADYACHHLLDDTDLLDYGKQCRGANESRSTHVSGNKRSHAFCPVLLSMSWYEGAGT